MKYAIKIILQNYDPQVFENANLSNDKLMDKFFKNGRECKLLLFENWESEDASAHTLLRRAKGCPEIVPSPPMSHTSQMEFDPPHPPSGFRSVSLRLP